MRPGEKRAGPRIITPEASHRVEAPASTDTATVPAGADSGRCWRCGVPFARTDMMLLARCTGLAAGADDHPLHYADGEVAEMWAGDLAALAEWLHRRAAGEADP